MNSHKKHRHLGTVLVTLGGLAFCTAANAQAPTNDECEGAVTITCGSSGTTNNCPATSGVNDPFPSCTFGADFGSVYFTFQPTATSARIRTDLNSIAPDSEFVVYDVNQGGDICDETQWTEVGCADDDPTDFFFNGDICVEGLDTTKTYVIVLFSFSTASCGEYTVNIECPCPSTTVVCGNGVIESGETCDDGNTVDGDGCAATCTVESGYGCVGEPSACFVDCNANGIPDECDLNCGTLNGPCDVAGCGQSSDSDGDGVPDECDTCPGFNDAEPCPIPAVSDWGLITMTLLVLSAGTLVLSRKRIASST